MGYGTLIAMTKPDSHAKSKQAVFVRPDVGNKKGTRIRVPFIYRATPTRLAYPSRRY